MKLQLVVAIFLSLTYLPLLQSADSAGVLLRHVREALIGEHKNTESAKKLLLEALEKGGLDPDSLCYAYVYLGYIEDRAKNREAAAAWFTKAASIQDAHSGTLGLAKAGLQKPITWIRHLDEASPASVPSEPPATKAMKIGKGYVATSPPTGLSLAKTLSTKERQENFDILWEAIDKTYAAFKLKSID